MKKNLKIGTNDGSATRTKKVGKIPTWRGKDEVGIPASGANKYDKIPAKNVYNDYDSDDYDAVDYDSVDNDSVDYDLVD